jgi:hypothetical protein
MHGKLDAHTKPLYLVKITSKKYSDSLLDGTIFMSPLSNFASLEHRPASSNNSFRGDIFEGLSNTFPRGIGSTFFQDAFGDPQNGSMIAGQIAECYLQERIYSLYSLYYDIAAEKFETPSEKLKSFGEVAVIIHDAREFLYRVFMEALSVYGDAFWMGANHVRYDINFQESSVYDDFSKTPEYSWQNEFRLAIDVNVGKADRLAWHRMTDLARIMFLNHGGSMNDYDHCSIVSQDVSLDQPAPRIVRNPVTLQIGSIRDFAASISTEEFIRLDFPTDEFRSVPTSVEPVLPPRPPTPTSYSPIFGWK